MHEKEILDQKWRDSPAKTLTQASYLPSKPGGFPTKSIQDIEAERQTAALEMVELSGDLLGRASQDRRLYLETSGRRYGQVAFLSQASELSGLFSALESSNSSLEAQDPLIIDTVLKDIDALAERSEMLFGSIDPERWQQVAYRAKQDSLRILADDSSIDSLKQAARSVLARFPDVEAPAATKEYAPSQELIDHWQPILEKYYAPLTALLDKERQDPYSSEDLKELFERGIETLKDSWGLEEARTWPVVIGKTSISVDHEESCVWVPPEKNYTPKKAETLLIHEIGGHLLRVLNGRMTGDAFLGSDMPGRHIDEEGLLVVFEQILSGQPAESGMVYFVSVALAGENTNALPVPLSELREVTLDYLAVKRGRPLTEKEITEDGNRVDRISRGMPSVAINGKLHQATYNEDLKYSLGQENAVAYLEAHLEDSELALEEVLSGRFAYSNPQQVAYARTKRAASLN